MWTTPWARRLAWVPLVLLVLATVLLARQAWDPEQVHALLVDRLAHADSYKVRALAATLLGRSGRPDAVAPLVRALVYDRHDVVRSAAAGALGELRDDRSLEPLFVAVTDPQPLVRRSAAQAVLRLDARRNLDAYVRYARSGTPDQRQAAVTRLGALARTGEARALDAVVNALSDAPEIRSAAAQALRDLPDDTANPVLAAALEHPSEDVRRAAAAILAERNGPDAPPGTRILAPRAGLVAGLQRVQGGSGPMAASLAGGQAPAGANTERVDAPLADPCAFSPERFVSVSTSAQLRDALAHAAPGDLVQLADGTYAGNFELAASGTADARIVLCGTRQAVLDGQDVSRGYGLHVTGNHVVLSGFTVKGSGKGVVLDGASDCLLTGLEVFNIGQEGIHLRAASSRNTVQFSSVHDTGKGTNPKYGEGVYVGSAESNWCTYTNCQPDRSDGNVIRGNTLGPNTTAENLDIKEGTTGGKVIDNVFDGTGMVNPAGGDSWVDVKGNGWVLQGNHGTNAPADGFQVHQVVSGWGQGNHFEGNVARVNAPGYGFRMSSGGNNMVHCDNQAVNAAAGLANVNCQ